MVASNESRDHDDHPALILAIVDHSCAQAAAPRTSEDFVLAHLKMPINNWGFFRSVSACNDQKTWLSENPQV